MTGIVYIFLTTLIITTGADKTLHKSKPNVRIVGGDPAKIEDYPYQVSIRYQGTHNCGGSIIKPLYILTAAHCTDGIKAEYLSIRAGSTMVDEGGQIRQVIQIYQHNQFDSDTYDYDISILKLDETLTLGVGVATIQLPNQGDDIEDGATGIATGWGRLSENGPLPMELQEVSLPTITNEICNMVYNGIITDRMFCAGYVQGLKDTCEGDSGGPFVYNGVQLGLTSWGDGCGKSNSPGVYTRLSQFRNYIDAIVNS